MMYNTQCTHLMEYTYLILVCALRELFELGVQHSELPGDALYPCMQATVLTVLGIEVVFVTLTLLRGADHRVLPVQEREEDSHCYVSFCFRGKSHAALNFSCI